MRKFTLLTFIITACFSLNSLRAQQDAMFTKYMFNSLIFNPAYAGSNDHLSLNLIHRSQWVGVNGAPTTQSFTIHSPLRDERVGVGLSAVNDAIGPIGTLDVNIPFAYRIPVGKGKLSIGLQGGVTNWRADWTKLNIEDPTDNVFQGSPNKWLFNFGAGVYYYSKYFYTGFGVPRMVEYDLREPNAANTPLYAKTFRHYYGTMGAAIPLKGDNLVFKPSILVKSAGLFSSIRKDEAFRNINAPTEIDLDLSLLFHQSLWIGAAYRTAIETSTSSNDSFDVWAAYIMKNGLRLGIAYDYTLTDIQKVTSGSFEAMVGYEFDYKTKRVVTPRYF